MNKEITWTYWSASGVGFEYPGGILASQMLLATLLPIDRTAYIRLLDFKPKRTFTWSGSSLSRVKDRTLEMCTPKDLCTPEQLMQMKMPILTEIQVGSCWSVERDIYWNLLGAPQSAQKLLPGTWSNSFIAFCDSVRSSSIGFFLSSFP